MFWLHNAIDPVQRHIVFVEHNEFQQNFKNVATSWSTALKLIFCKIQTVGSAFGFGQGYAFRHLQVKKLRFWILIFACDQL